MEKKKRASRWSTDDRRNIRRIMAHLLTTGSMDDLPNEKAVVSLALEKCADILTAPTQAPAAPVAVKK